MGPMMGCCRGELRRLPEVLPRLKQETRDGTYAIFRGNSGGCGHRRHHGASRHGYPGSSGGPQHRANVGRVASRTHVSIQKGRWFLNDAVTYRGTQAEGLLMNVRMVNAVFEDRNRPDFDPNANTDEFIAQIPDYVAHGVRAFTICLQGRLVRI